MRQVTGVHDLARTLGSEPISAAVVGAAKGLRSLLGPGFVVVAAAPQAALGDPPAEEWDYVRRATARRQAEFLSARICARRALAELGVKAGSLIPYPDRSPRWPVGVRGSISHAATCCAVVVAPDSLVAGIGIDLEPAEPLEAPLIARICTSAERTWLGGFAASRRGLIAKLIFSAKEAVYKCQYPNTRKVMDFLDLDLAVDLERGRFAVTSTIPPAPVDWRHLRGRFAFTGAWVLAGAVMAH
jgi:4'-phosphopantetheinyl transferase EntD